MIAVQVRFYEDELGDLGESIYLAGPTATLSGEPIAPWRDECISFLARTSWTGTVIVPAFRGRRSLGGRLVITWEREAMERASVILFWIPRTPDLVGLTTNVEFGYWAAHHRAKLVYGRPEDAYACLYLDMLWKETAKDPTQAVIHRSLADTAAAALALCKPG